MNNGHRFPHLASRFPAAVGRVYRNATNDDKHHGNANDVDDFESVARPHVDDGRRDYICVRENEFLK